MLPLRVRSYSSSRRPGCDQTLPYGSHYSDTWQLFINTITNLVTFLMVFLIQRAQNKDTMALQLKVNELIAAQKGAHNSMINIESLSETELRSQKERFSRLAEGLHGNVATSVAMVTVESL